jgi:uncharacterized membrane protein YfcA
VSDPLRPPLQAPLRLAPFFWRVTALIAARAAVVLLSMHGDVTLNAAAVLAAGTAIAAQAEARFRARRGQSSDLANILVMALALATVLTCILALAAANRPR